MSEIDCSGALFEGVSESLLISFKAFHRENPDVYQLFKELALQLKQVGKTRYSAWPIINAIRWEKDIRTRTNDKFKLNNNFIALYARLLMTELPETFKDFFSLREMKHRRVE